jgi:hypothetical protein
LALTFSLLYREQILINVLKVLASAFYMWSFQVQIFGKWDILSIQCNMSLRPLVYEKSGLSLLFIDFNILAITPHLNSTETLLQPSDNITFFTVCCIYTGVINKET